ncbi:hypothetical protein N9917_00650 [Deltaproteobacteria bacterium]|nr:hypothetical protein [Deltaproteobacteria bacterium]
MSVLRSRLIRLASTMQKGPARQGLLEVLAYGENPEELAAIEEATALIDPLLRRMGFKQESGGLRSWTRTVEDPSGSDNYRVVKFEVFRPSKGYRKGLHIQFGPQTVRGWVGAPDKVETRTVNGKLLAKKFKAAIKKSEAMGWTRTIW